MKPTSPTLYGLWIYTLNFLVSKNELDLGVIIMDENQRMLICNQQFCDMFNLTETPNDLIGTYFIDIIDKISDVIPQLNSMNSDIRKTINDELTCISKTNNIPGGITIERSAFPVYDANNNYKGHSWQFRIQ
jgi:PAS domain-containing protein